MKDIQISEDYVPKIKRLFKNKHIHSQNGNHDCVVITQETPLVIKETRLFLNKLSLNPLRFTLGPYDIKCRVGAGDGFFSPFLFPKYYSSMLFYQTPSRNFAITLDAAELQTAAQLIEPHQPVPVIQYKQG